MIDLNKKYTARKDTGLDFSPAPEGDYVLRVLEVKPWEAKKPQNIQVIQRDENGRAIKDDKGKNVTELEEGVIVYNSFVTFEIAEGDQAGKRVFHNLTTHPNAPFSISSFLYGLGVETMAAADIPTQTVGKYAYAKIFIDTYEKQVQDKDTGLMETAIRESNKIKHFLKLPENYTNTPTNSSEETIPGI